jgi:RND family efflux transporter MFP subunit
LLPEPSGGPALTATVARSSLSVTVSAGGELASSDAIEVICEVEGQEHKVIQMLGEGTQVKAGQVVIQLDPSAITDRLSEQQIAVTQAEALAKAAAEDLKIQRNLADSQIAAAELALQLARLDQEKYLNGEYKIEFNDLQGSIALARADLQDAKTEHGHFQELVKKGFRTPEQLRAKEQAVKRAEYNLSRDEGRIQVLEEYTRRREVTELEAKAAEASRELERAKSTAAAAIVKAETDLEVARATAELKDKQLERIQKQLELCAVRAPTGGTVVYAKEKNKAIELGGVVHYKQRLFSLPSSDQMQVNAFVHESLVKKVRSGMPVEIRIDAFPDLVLQGTVEDVASFYDSTRHWLSGGVKEYAATIAIDELPETALRAGMTAEVKILVDQLANSLVVPVAAVTEKNGRHLCFVLEDDRAEPRLVSIGANTAQYVEITAGLQEGERVALDARRRANAELQLPTAAEVAGQGSSSAGLATVR